MCLLLNNIFFLWVKILTYSDTFLILDFLITVNIVRILSNILRAKINPTRARANPCGVQRVNYFEQYIFYTRKAIMTFCTWIISNLMLGTENVTEWKVRKHMGSLFICLCLWVYECTCLYMWADVHVSWEGFPMAVRFKWKTDVST